MSFDTPRRLPPFLHPFVDDIHRLIGPVYLVGATIRDLLLERPLPVYLHLLVSRPLSECWQRLHEGGYSTAQVGNKHNCLLLPLKGNDRPKLIEISTFRHRPNSPATVEEDLLHRDLTINAMAVLWPDGELIDPYEGRKDLDRGRIHLINGLETIRENPLRALRLFRQSLQLTMQPDAADLTLAADTDPHLVPGDQIRAEMDRIFSLPLNGPGDQPLLERLFDSLLGRTIFPEQAGETTAPGFGAIRLVETLQTLTHPERSEEVALMDLRWAALLFRLIRLETAEGAAQPASHRQQRMQQAAGILQRFDFSKRRQRRILSLLEHSNLPLNPTDRLLNRLLKQGIPLEGLFRLVVASRRPADRGDAAGNDRSDGELNRTLKRCQHLVDASHRIKPTDLAISGGEILDLVRQPPGPWMGVIQKILVEWVSEDPRRNHPEQLSEKVREWLADT